MGGQSREEEVSQGDEDSRKGGGGNKGKVGIQRVTGYR